MIQKLRTHLGDKLWTNQQFNASKVSENTVASTEDIVEKILEREGTLDVFFDEIPPYSQTFLPTAWIQLKKNCNIQLKIMALQKNIDVKYNF